MMIGKYSLALAATLFSSSVFAQSCNQDFDFISPMGHEQGPQLQMNLKKGLGAGAKGNFEAFMSIAADPYIQHSPDLKDGWKPVWDLMTNRSKSFSSKLVKWVGPHGFMDNGQYLVMFREVDHGDGKGPEKKFDLMYFDDQGLYSEHWDMAEHMMEKPASGRRETATAAKFTDNPVKYDLATEEANRRLVTAYLNLAMNGKEVGTALNLYAAEDYISYNPMVSAGPESVAQAYSDGKIASRCYDIQFILAQNDLVWAFSKATGEDGVFAAVDMFRVRDNKMVEHWDVVQAVPSEMPHDNGMF